MGKCYVKAYYDWIEQTAALTDAERGRLFIAILEYARTGIPPELEGAESILFPVFRTMLDRDDELSAERSRNGAKGGKQTQASASKIKQTEANANDPKPTILSLSVLVALQLTHPTMAVSAQIPEEILSLSALLLLAER